MLASTQGSQVHWRGHWPSKLEPRLPSAASYWSRRVPAPSGPGKHPVVDCEACSHLIGTLRLGPYTRCKNPRR